MAHAGAGGDVSAEDPLIEHEDGGATSALRRKSSSASRLQPPRPRGSIVWLTGALCSPLRLPLGVILSVCKCIVGARMSSARDWKVLGLFFGSLVAVYVAFVSIQTFLGTDLKDEHWLLSLLVNVLGYGTVFIPGYVVIRHVRESNYLEQASTSQSCMEPIVRLFIRGSEESIDETIVEQKTTEEQQTKAKTKSEAQVAATLLFCFFGLQVSYLTWGVLQEKIMTKSYVDSAGNKGQFKDSQFLVFVNRILAFAIAALYIIVSSRQPRHRAPLYKYSFCSLSNIMSSWFQYEALKYVSFPTQVMAKASKIIPVMIMGWIVSRRTYEKYEYLVAVLISLGMGMFLLGTQEERAGASSVTTVSGVFLLVGYMATDSFTSNWQNELFNTYKMSSVQMMCGVNLFSCLLTSSSLLQQGSFYTSLVFMSQFPAFAFDCIVLSVCSAVGQLFIYHTISEFGAVVFVIIMTLRQAMAVLLSCIIYSHPVTATGVVGIITVFGAMFLKTYCGHRLKRLKAAKAKAAAAAALNTKNQVV